MADDSPLVNFLKVAAGLHEKDQSRYGDDPTALISPDKGNQYGAHYLLGPPRTSNTPGYDTETSSSRQPNPGASRRNVVNEDNR